ncbi:MAG TPA: PEP-utilizing enzyme [Acidimicrobiia bacterium]|nr:PEP-utilizing enzyme [Acidimicrobiia bacterium]
MTTSSDREVLVVDLDDEAALDIFGAGAKAAWLARARRAGLPVLPGLVVRAAVSRAAISTGLDRLSSGGSGAARMAITTTSLPQALVMALAERIPWPRLAVRSSSPLEGFGEWSGAFSSYLDVGREEVAKTINGCWASSFSVSTLERFERTGLEPSPLAVLIQPFLAAETGGTASVGPSAVVIESVSGPPQGLLAGHLTGRRSTVDMATGTVAGFVDPVIERVARWATAAHTSTGATYLEWAAVAGEVTILQLASPQRVAPPELAMVLPADPELCRLARIVRRFPGPLGEKLVLPWALSLENPACLDEVEPIKGGSLTMIRDLARTQANRVWQSSIGQDLAAATLAELAGDPLSVLPVLARLRPAEHDQARRIVGLIRGLGGTGHPEELWYLSESEIDEGGPGPLRLPRDRFEPLGASMTEADGQRRSGVAASPGIGFGRGVVIVRPEGAKLGPRRVIVAPEPIPHLAPLLWNAAGLVTVTGSPAAHLFESARSLGVPAVAAVTLDPTSLSSGAWAVALDGTRGTVTFTDW